MNGYCDWCECGDRPMTPFRDAEICPECHEALIAREEREREEEERAREAALPRRERMALQRARDAGVD